MKADNECGTSRHSVPTVAEIAEVAAYAAERGIALLRLQEGDDLLELWLETTIPSDHGTIPAPSRKEITASCPGFIRLTHPDGDAEIGSLPRRTGAGSVEAYLENGFILFPVVSDFDGEMQELLVGDGAVAGYGTPVFGLLPEAAGKEER
ncbi:hypothetical protein [Aquamicrobium sp. LC103]|uniref:hypothetical protein n=1 Tax=Aquamicrobium sp. LC103 TaxID=1120658 RepID=UPI00063ECCAD|nr:hypothetical protein [Aquamicrobium sp. LC103]TKT76241.1 hypothetical protein XW59_016855 [Aquamicrobium sp. LC103]